MLKSRFITLGLLPALVLSALAVGVSPAADHRDAPALAFSPFNANPNLRSLDLNDVYLFQSPANPNNTVLMATVNPLLAPGEVAFFSSTGSYEFKISNGANAVAHPAPEITFSCKFTAPRAGRQEIRLTKINHVTNRSELIARGQTGSNIAVRGGGQLRADLFDDPFFFDFLGFTGGGGRRFNDGTATPQPDFFAGTNVGIIVLEVPSTSLTGGNLTNPVITMWGRTLLNNVQIDRTAIPVVNPVLIRPNRFLNLLRPFNEANGQQTTPPLKDRFNVTEASQDRAMWGQSNATGETSEIFLNLTAFGNDETTGPFTRTQLLNAVNPDVLTFNVTSAAGFNSGPLNGRRLEDDVIDLELSVIVQIPDSALFGATGDLLETGGNVGLPKGDGVHANDKPFRNRFPYAAVRHGP